MREISILYIFQFRKKYFVFFDNWIFLIGNMDYFRFMFLIRIFGYKLEKY